MLVVIAKVYTKSIILERELSSGEMRVAVGYKTMESFKNFQNVLIRFCKQ